MAVTFQLIKVLVSLTEFLGLMVVFVLLIMKILNTYTLLLSTADYIELIKVKWIR